MARLSAAVFLCLAVAFPSAAQVDQRSGSALSALSGNPLTALRARTGASSSAMLLPMEGPVDADAYVVGPGDYFAVTVQALDGITMSIPVSADGNLTLPEAGAVPVAGLTLRAARDIALEALRPHFERSAMSVSLAQPRQFYVHVTGSVPVPGRYLALPVARVSDVLELAFADTSRSPVGNASYRPSLRNVTVIRRDGSEHEADLLRYFSAGDTRQNPYLQDGDVIRVPGYDPDFESVFVDGAVPFPGSYDFRIGDTLRDLLAVAGMTRAPAHVTRVRITSPSRPQPIEVPLADVFAAGAEPHTLMPRDHVSIAPDAPPGGRATVSGWVRNPGTYAIEEGKTSVQDLLAMAGGLREGALTSGAHLQRLALPTASAVRSGGGRFQDPRGFTRTVPNDSLAVLHGMRLTDLDFGSRSYFAQELRTQNRVSTNLAAVLAGGSSSVLVRDGDRLVVPRDEQSVYVFGQVVRPGFVALTPGMPADHYLRAAGGRAFNGGSTYVISGATGERITDPQKPLASGDLVFVDRLNDIADTPQLQQLALQAQSIESQESIARSNQRLQIAQILVGTLGTLATVVTLVLTQRN